MPTTAPDPMQEQARNALRRKCADMLHSLARKIENGTYEVIQVNEDAEIERDEGGPPYQALDHHHTGRVTLRVAYDTKPGKRS